MKYFTVNELCVSATYPKLVEVPKPGTSIYNNIVKLINNLLDPVRTKLNQPISVSSGYRNEKLNTATKGSKTSMHRYGLAADTHTGKGGADNLKIVEALLESNVPFDQCIIEYPTIKNGKIIAASWIHLGLNTNGNNRKQILYTIDGLHYPTVKINKNIQYNFNK